MKLNPYGEKLNIAGAYVRALRIERGVSQEQLAAKLRLLGQ